MSAGFKLADEVFWGTNGAVEAYVEAIADQANRRYGPDDRLALFFKDERDSFSSGKIVVLDEWLADPVSRTRFLELLDAATQQLQQDGSFTEYGREWVTSVINELRSRIAENCT